MSLLALVSVRRVAFADTRVLNRIVELATCAVILALVVGGCGWALISWGPGLACEHLGICPPAPGEQELAPFIDDYLGAAGVEIDAQDYVGGVGYLAPPGNPYRIGRVAVVDVDERRIDPKLTRALPLDIVATLPEEVATVIWLRWGETREGEYHANGGGPVTGRAYRGYCDLVVIDVAAGLIVGTREFLAISPPTTTTASGDIHTEVDVESVANWVKALPVRDSSPTPSVNPTPTNTPRPSDVGPAALEPGQSLTLSGDQTGSDLVVPAESFHLAAGEYTVDFEGRSSKACSNCMAIKVFNERDEYPIFIVNDPDRIAAGGWRFTGVFTLAWWEDGASFHFELSMPKGSWTIALTRDS